MLSEGDDDEGEDMVPLSNAVADEAHRKARAERAEQLKNMMDDDGKACPPSDIHCYAYGVPDEEMADAPPAEAKTAEEEEEEAAPIDKAAAPQVEEKEAFVEVSGGRRRGRRRVMKKWTMKDEEGYLGEPNQVFLDSGAVAANNICIQ